MKNLTSQQATTLLIGSGIAAFFASIAIFGPWSLRATRRRCTSLTSNKGLRRNFYSAQTGSAVTFSVD